MNAEQDWMAGGERRNMETFLRVEAIASDMIEIKSSLKEMAVALSKLAIVEERQMQDRSSMDRIFKELVGHESRLKLIELAQPIQNQTTDWVSRLVWVILGAIVAAIFSVAMIERSIPKAAHIAQHQTTTGAAT